jgi:VCBS repeat-containing protein
MPNATPSFTASPSTLLTSQNYAEGGSTTTGLFLSAAANVGSGESEGSGAGQQLFESVTLKVSNVFTGDKLRIDGALVNVDTTTTSSITAGTYKVDVTVSSGISTVTISRPVVFISSANLQTLVENIGFASSSNNPTDFGNKTTRGITIYEVVDNAGTPLVPNDGASVLPNITATVTIATINTPVAAANDVNTGANAAVEGSVPVLATGNALTNDIDPDSILSVSSVVGGTFNEGSASVIGTYGVLSINTNGSYTYTADAGNTLVNSMNVGSASLVDTFTYTASDGFSSSTATIKIDIKGGNNSASITGDTSRTINESIVTTAGTSVTGTLVSADVDNASTWTASTGSTTHGSYGIDAAGDWTYTLDNGNTAVNALNVGSSFVDTFSVQTIDGTSQTVSVTIQGKNDSAVITGATSGSINESVTVLTGTTTTGTLTSTDVDNPNTWTASTGSTTHGSYGLDSLGAWTYTLDNGNTAVDALNVGGSFVDTFTVSTVGGTTQIVSVTINGQNDAAVITGTTGGSINESVTVLTGTTTTGTLTSTDVDNPNTWTASTGSTTHGSYSLDSLGAWTYTLDNGNSAVNALNVGGSFVDTFTVGTVDGTTRTVSVTINGQNDAAVFFGPAGGSINESVTVLTGTTTTGTLASFDVDNPNTWNTSNGLTTHGSYSLDSLGAWTYTLNNGNSSVNALNVGGSFVDSFTVSTVDGTTRTVSVTINGQNDNAVITSGANSYNGNLTEASGLNNSINNALANSRASGTVTYTDVDNAGTAWVPTASPVVTASQKGSYTVSAAGTWVYDLNNNYGDVQALQVGQSTTDTFTITTTGGTTQTVTVIITGGNDLPTITTPLALSGSVIEAGGVANGTLNTPTDSKNITFTDPDNTADVWQVIPSGTNATYGTYGVNAFGEWTYTLNNSLNTVNALNVGSSLVDTFVVTTNDGTTQTVSVTINGRNDAAVITGSLSGTITERSGLNNAVFGNGPGYTLDIDSATGIGSGAILRTVTTTDVDSPGFLATTYVGNPFTLASMNGYGRYANDGVQWGYSLNETNATVQGLNVGQSLTDSFTLAAIDGTTTTVNIVIQGANDEAIVAGDINNKSVTEDKGFNNSIAGTPTATGNLTYTDVDNAGSAWVAQDPTFTGTFGIYSITNTGAWTYTVNNGNGLVDGLKGGQSLTDSFVVATAGGTTQTVTVKIIGANDSAIVTGQTTAALNESGVFTVGAAAGNNLNYTDPDNIADGWTAVSTPTLATGGHGNYTIDADGVWSYSLLTGSTIVESLAAGVTVVDTFVATTTDGTTQVVSVTITGQNDAAIITNALTAAVGSLTEASGISNGTPGTTASADLNATDIDNAPDSWIPVTLPGGNNATYGKYSIDAAGKWNYIVDNSNSAVQWLNVGTSLSDTFTVSTIDGTTQSVTVKINGANDSALLSGTFAATVTEASGVSNATAGTGTVTGSVNVSDVDNSANLVAATGATSYGNYSVLTDGEGNNSWSYGVNETNTNVQALNVGGSLVDTFTISAVDGTTKSVSITINGANDAAVITGDIAGSATEAGGISNGALGTSATGNLNAADVDNSVAGNSDLWILSGGSSAGGYGTYSIAADGQWNYTVNNNNPSVQWLNLGTSIADTFVATTIDGSASQTVTVIINGTDDAATFTNFTGSVTEAGGTANGTPGVAFVTNTLIVADVDNTYPGWTGQNVTGTYGTFNLAPCVGPVVSTTHADWTYTLNDNDPDTQALKFGESVTETFTAVNGGVSQVVTITIVGTNDNPALTGTASTTPLATIAENTAPYTITTAQLLQGFSDVDAGQTATLSIANLVSSPAGTFTLSSGTYTFVPTNSDYFGTVSLSYDVQDVDGGVYAATTSFNITPVNDAPTATAATVSLTGVNEDTTNPAGATVGSLFSSVFSDAKDAPAPNSFIGVAIVNQITNVSQGTWEWLDTSNGWQPINSVSTAGALFLDTATKVRFLPALDFNGVPNSLQARLVETGALNNFSNPATTGDLLNVSGANSGGTTHVSNLGNTVTLSTVVNPIDDPTNITGNTVGTVTEDTTISFSGSLVATDPDVSGPLFTPVTNQNGANNYGKFTILNNGTWQYNLDNNNPLVQHLGAANSLTDTYTFNTTTGASQTVSVTINGTVDAGVSITGTSADNVINGKDGNDYLNGGLGNDSLIGGLGNDILDGAVDTTGLDTFAGGAGDDSYGVYNSATTITENVGEGNDTAWTAVNYTLADNVENLYVVGALTGTGNSGDNLIVGFGEDNQTLLGLGGNDVIYGGNGADYLVGGTGNDYVDGGAGNDILDGAGDSAGLDTFAGGAGDDIYGVYNSATTITEKVGEGNDTVWTAVNYTLADNVENLYVVGALTGTGNSGDNLIVGFGEDNQTLLGLGGNDVIYGGNGADYLVGGTGNDYVDGGAGNDILDGAGDSAGLDTFAGGAGDDIYGVYNSATMIVENAGEGTDTVWTAVNYTLTNEVENLFLVGNLTGTGNSGNNLIIGYGVGDNMINGGAGADTIDGGAGTDVISGGTGADIFTFVFTQSTATATDRITDFEIGTDKLDIFTPTGVAASPTSFSRAGDDSTSINLSNLALGVYANADGAGNGLAAGAAALVVSTGSIAGTYVVIDDGVAGFNAADDLVINITGYTGALPTNPTSVSSFFKV